MSSLKLLSQGNLDLFFNCINVSSYSETWSSNRNDPVPHVNVVTYASPSQTRHGISDIEAFSVLQNGIMAAYAEHNEYTFRAFGPESNHFPPDPRWNKVKIVSLALDQQFGWIREGDYILWIDADAIILDLSMRLENFGALYPEADIIASADIKMGYINSGVMLLKNTKWTRAFLSEWWIVADKSYVCDQDAFDMVLSKRIKEAEVTRGAQGQESELKKLKVLDMSVLNSHPPAVAYHGEKSQVLHLMGEVTAMRSAIFLHALNNVCNSLSASTRGSPELEPTIPKQLGINRELLQNTAIEVYERETTNHFDHAEMNLFNDEESHAEMLSSIDVLEELNVLIHHLCDVHSTLVHPENKEKERKLRYRFLDLVRRRVIKVKERKWNITSELMSSVSGKKNHKGVQWESKLDSLSSLLVGLLRKQAQAANDVFAAMSGDDDKQREIGTQILTLLDELYGSLAPQSQFVALHMRALILTSLGDLELSIAYSVVRQTSHQDASVNQDQLNSLDASHKHFSDAVNNFDQIFRRGIERLSNPSLDREYLSSLEKLAMTFCLLTQPKVAPPYSKYGSESTSLVKEVKSLWKRAIEVGRENTRGVPFGPPMDQLSKVQLNAAVCFKDLQRYGDTVSILDALLETSSPESSDYGVAVNLRRYSLEMLENSHEVYHPDESTDDDEDSEWEECIEGEEGCFPFLEVIKADEDPYLPSTEEVSVDNTALEATLRSLGGEDSGEHIPLLEQLDVTETVSFYRRQARAYDLHTL
jgi:hypothetical protein